MGVGARLENRCGDVLAEVRDAQGYVNWLLSFVDESQTACLRFIDPYGDTVFNSAQMRELAKELKALRSRITDKALRLAKDSYLQSTTGWPAKARADATRYTESLSTEDLTRHLSQLIALLDVAHRKGPHHYVRFVGD
jgi:hypothetical protein